MSLFPDTGFEEAIDSLDIEEHYKDFIKELCEGAYNIGWMECEESE